MAQSNDRSPNDLGAEFSIEVREEQGQTVVLARLPLSADICYRLFSNIDLIPKWLWVVDTAVVHRRDEQQRAVLVDFIASLERASIGYTLRYDYDDAAREVRWHHVGGGMSELVGSARFVPRPDGGCVMEYHLASEKRATLPPWADTLYQQRPQETVVADFCDFVERWMREQQAQAALEYQL